MMSNGSGGAPASSGILGKLRTAGSATAAVGRVESLTGMRWWAAFAVFTFHTTSFALLPQGSGPARFGQFGGYTALGFAGVTFFFVLSGFVLTWAYKAGDSPLRFYQRRLARIWPMIPVSSLLFFVVVFWGQAKYPVDGLWRTLTLQQAWSKDHYYSSNGATWSLSCEAFFYLLFPFLIRPLMLLGLRSIAVLAAVDLAVVVTAPPPFAAQVMAGSPAQRLPEFILGILTGVAVRKGWRPRISAHWTMAFIAVAGVAVFWWFRDPRLATVPSPFPVLTREIFLPGAHHFRKAISPVSVMDQVFAPLFALCIAAVAIRDLEGGRSWLRSRPLVMLGKWSFSFYLIEGTVILAGQRWIGLQTTPSWGNLGYLTGALVVAVALSAACFHAVEQPMERYLKGLWPRPRAGAESRAQVSAEVPASREPVGPAAEAAMG